MSAACILVVEDEAIIARDIQATLQRFGYLVPPPVNSCEAAMSSLALHHPDLVLMDINIQGGVDGMETAARIRDSFRTPVIYLTSYSDRTTMATAKATGASGYILKPFRARDLSVAIEAALKNARRLRA